MCRREIGRPQARASGYELPLIFAFKEIVFFFHLFLTEAWVLWNGELTGKKEIMGFYNTIRFNIPFSVCTWTIIYPDPSPQMFHSCDTPPPPPPTEPLPPSVPPSPNSRGKETVNPIANFILFCMVKK